jgi:hypothetical protein
VKKFQEVHKFPGGFPGVPGGNLIPGDFQEFQEFKEL